MDMNPVRYNYVVSIGYHSLPMIGYILLYPIDFTVDLLFLCLEVYWMFRFLDSYARKLIALLTINSRFTIF